MVNDGSTESKEAIKQTDEQQTGGATPLDERNVWWRFSDEEEGCTTDGHDVSEFGVSIFSVADEEVFEGPSKG